MKTFDFLYNPLSFCNYTISLKKRKGFYFFYWVNRLLNQRFNFLKLNMRYCMCGVFN